MSDLKKDKKSPNWQLDDAELQSRIDATWAALDSESDRAIPLIAGQWLSDSLETLLRAKFRAENVSDKDQDRLLKMYNAPLFSFAVRTSVCRAFGLIPQEIHDVLEAIREIRNYCAHSVVSVSLEDTKIQKWVRILQDYLVSKQMGWATINKKPMMSSACAAVTAYLCQQTIGINLAAMKAIEKKYGGPP